MLDRPMHAFQATDGLTLRYALDDFTNPWEEPPTLLLLHAAMGSSRRMYAWVPHLCRDFRVVRPDLRGHGGSDIPGEGQLDIERMTTDVIELLDHLGVERAHLAGSSAGGIVCMHTAITHPERVATLATFAATPGLKISAGHTDFGSWADGIRAEGVESFLRRTIATRFDLDSVDPRFIDWFIEEAGRNDPELLCRFVGMMAAVDFSDRLGEVRCPTLAVGPGGDPIHTMDEYGVVRDRIGDCEFLVYPGMRHNITDAVPDRCAEDLSAFLKRHVG